MSISRQLLTVAMAGMVFFSAAAAEAKGPKGSNQGKGPSFSTGTSQGQGIQGGDWTTPPGWTQGQKKGWEGQTVPPVPPVPPGFENGNKQGWQTESLPPGLQKKQ